MSNIEAADGVVGTHSTGLVVGTARVANCAVSARRERRCSSVSPALDAERRKGALERSDLGSVTHNAIDYYLRVLNNGRDAARYRDAVCD